MYGAQAGVARFLETFQEFPPSQRPASFTIDQAMEKLQAEHRPQLTTPRGAGRPTCRPALLLRGTSAEEPK